MNNSDLANMLNITPEKLKKRAAALGIRTGGRGSVMSNDEMELIIATKDYSLSELRVYKDCLMSKFKNPELFKEFLQKQYDSEVIESMVNVAMRKNSKSLRSELQKWYRNREKLFKQEIVEKVDKLQENFDNAKNSAIITEDSEINHIIGKIESYRVRLHFDVS